MNLFLVSRMSRVVQMPAKMLVDYIRQMQIHRPIVVAEVRSAAFATMLTDRRDYKPLLLARSLNNLHA